VLGRSAGPSSRAALSEPVITTPRALRGRSGTPHIGAALFEPVSDEAGRAALTASRRRSAVGHGLAVDDTSGGLWLASRTPTSWGEQLIGEVDEMAVTR
jgi:hypothetical protein